MLFVYWISSLLVVWVNKAILEHISVCSLMLFQGLIGLMALGFRRAAWPSWVDLGRPLGWLVALTKLLDIGANLYMTAQVDVATATALRRLNLTLICLGELVTGQPITRKQAYGNLLVLFGVGLAVWCDGGDPTRYVYIFAATIITAFNNLLTTAYLRQQPQATTALQCSTTLLVTLTMMVVVGFSHLRTQRDLQAVGRTVEKWWLSVLICISGLPGVVLNRALLCSTLQVGPIKVAAASATRNVVLGWGSMLGWIGKDYVYTAGNVVGLQLAAAGCLLCLL